MTLKRISTLGFLLALLAGALPYHWASAQSPEVKAARENVQKTAEKSDERGAVSVQQVETTETRRATIVSVLDLTQAELEDTLGPKKLGAILKQEDVGLVTIAQELTDTLIMYQSYVRLMRAQVARITIGNDELKEIAVGLKEWREKVYEPAIRQAFSALLVMQGSDVLSTARLRLERVNADVKKIKAAVGAPADELVPMLESVRKNVASAASYHAMARTVLLEDEENFLANKRLVATGVPRPATLYRGTAGDFICSAGTEKGSVCNLVYKLHNGVIYDLRTKEGLPIVGVLGDIASVEGELVILTPIFPEDTIVGIFFVHAMNPAVSAGEDNESFSSMEASALESVGGNPSTATQTVQSLIKKEIDEIGQAYQTFFSMSRLAKKLMMK